MNRIDTPAGGSLGVTAAPFIRSGTAAVVGLARRADRLGYDSFWVAEVTGIEAFSVLGAASRMAPGLGLGTGVLAMQVRTPSLLAMAAASLQALAPDREVLLGVGVSSPGARATFAADLARLLDGRLPGDRRLTAAPRSFVTSLWWLEAATGTLPAEGGGRHDGLAQWATERPSPREATRLDPAARNLSARSSSRLSSAHDALEGPATDAAPGLDPHARHHRNPGTCGCCVHGDHFRDDRDA
jgi:alkanesulfonate monooxygenase SsuD/methylene tetrahydromethanopterin reductase-like flavin-dependent oxidoreductase (luciferase family)